MIITRTPFRVSFFGGGTDYPAWYEQHGGAVLTSSIDKYCYLSVRRLPPFFEYRHRVAWSKVELVGLGAEVEHPAVRAALQYLRVGDGAADGIEVHHSGDLPARTGLGSSSAFTVGLLHALQALKGVMPSRMELARQAIHVEQRVMGEMVGIQDQIECALGGLNHVEISTEGVWQVSPVILPRERRLDLERHLMLYFTGISRHASAIAKAQIQTLPERGGEMRDLAALVPEALSVLTGSGPLAEFGRLLDEGWAIKRRLSDLVSTPDIDALYGLARAKGAIGGKLLGAGGGGFLLLFASPAEQGRIRHALNHVLEVPLRFESGGSRIIYAEGA